MVALGTPFTTLVCVCAIVYYLVVQWTLPSSKQTSGGKKHSEIIQGKTRWISISFAQLGSSSAGNTARLA